MMPTADAARPLRVLGIDPGLRTTGFGVIDVTAVGQQLSYVASGAIVSGEGSLPQRIGVLFAGIREVVERYKPTHAAVEIVFVNVNPQSTLALGQARGAALAALSHQAFDVNEYTALQVKQAVVGHGKAAKEQVQAMVVRLLQLGGPPGSDASDALACAICHAHYLTDGRNVRESGQLGAHPALALPNRGSGRKAWRHYVPSAQKRTST